MRRLARIIARSENRRFDNRHTVLLPTYVFSRAYSTIDPIRRFIRNYIVSPVPSSEPTKPTIAQPIFFLPYTFPTLYRYFFFQQHPFLWLFGETRTSPLKTFAFRSIERDRLVEKANFSLLFIHRYYTRGKGGTIDLQKLGKYASREFPPLRATRKDSINQFRTFLLARALNESCPPHPTYSSSTIPHPLF